MSILDYNGGCVVAMVGKECVAIASDRRLGVQLTTVSMDTNRIFPMHDKLYMGLTGLQTDIITLEQLFRFKLELYSMRENRLIKPSTFANLVSTTLYGKRFSPYFCEPVVAGLGADNKPFICSMDLLGCIGHSDDFAVAGTCAESLLGTCETFYKKDLEPDQLFETVSQALLAALDRDCISGWGATVHIITKDGVQTKKLDGRMD